MTRLFTASCVCIHWEVNCAFKPSEAIVKSHTVCLSVRVGEHVRACVYVCVFVRKKDEVLLQHTTYFFTASVLLGVWDFLFLFSTKTKVYG